MTSTIQTCDRNVATNCLRNGTAVSLQRVACSDYPLAPGPRKTDFSLATQTPRRQLVARSPVCAQNSNGRYRRTKSCGVGDAHHWQMTEPTLDQTAPVWNRSPTL